MSAEHIQYCQFKIIGVLGHDSALVGYTGPGTTWADGMNFGMNIAPGAGSITRPINQQSSALYCSTDAPDGNSEKHLYMN